MPTPPEGEAVAVWRASMKRLRLRFQVAAKSYLSDHAGETLDLALIHCDQRFASLGASQENCVARDFLWAWHRLRGRRPTKKKGGIPTEPRHFIDHYWSARHSKQPFVVRFLYSNESLGDELEMERGKQPDEKTEEFFSEQDRRLQERRRRFRTDFEALVRDASRCLKNLPFDWNGRVAEEAVKSGDNERWLYCLFDVAWKSPGGLLNADRQFYFEPGNVSVPYEPGAYDHLREWVRRHRGEAEGRTGNIVPPSLPVEWEGRLPECYFSILRDFYGQSVAFVDWLLTVEKAIRDDRIAAAGNRSKRPAGTPSADAGAGVAKQVKRAKGKKDGPLKNSEELFKSALRRHHGYETGGSVSTYDYATTYRIAELVDERISARTAGRQFNEHFGNERKNGKGKTGGIDAYRHSCIAKTIGTKLMALFGDFMKTFGSLGDSQDGLSVEDDHEDDSDDEGDSPKRRGGQPGKVARKF